MRTYRRKQIEHVKYVMTLPPYIIQVMVHPSWKRIKSDWAKYEKMYQGIDLAVPDTDTSTAIMLRRIRGELRFTPISRNPFYVNTLAA
jgi:hypothetical protein